jgi:hypothetical protein
MNIKYRKTKSNILHGCVAGSRLPINNFVLTTLTGPLIVNVRIWNCEEEKEKKKDQLNF